MNDYIISFDIGIKNLAYCILKQDGDSYDIHDWDIITLINDDEKCNANKMDVTILGKRLMDRLDEHKEFLEIPNIVIENQPVLKNPKMKSIQMMVYSYFIIKNRHLPNFNIKLFSARNKLSIYNGPPVELESKSKNKYTIRKKLSIEYTKYMIRDHAEYLEFLTNHTKKDDLCDCFIQGACYLDK